MPDLTPEQLDEIERRAKAALEFQPAQARGCEPDTAPGWTVTDGRVDDGDVGGCAAFGRTHVYEDDSSEEKGAQVDAMHIAASSPANVLSLLAEVRRLRAEWIPVDERLPDDGAVVLIATLDDDYVTSARCRHGTPVRFFTLGGPLSRVSHEPPYVTHWRPLPKSQGGK